MRILLDLWHDAARAGRRVTLSGLAAVGLLASPALAQSAADAKSAPLAPGIVELPKFEVNDSRVLPPPEAWRYAEIPGFEILSNLSASRTKHFVQDFYLLQTVVEVLMPGLARGPTPVPTALILCGRGNSFDQFVPAERGEERYGTNTLFFKDPERSAIVVDFALGELRMADGTTEESDAYRAFYLSYFRFLLRRQLGDNAPAWFEEGLVQIFAATDFSRKWITFAQIGDGFGAEKTGDFNRRLQQRALLPMKELLEGTGKNNRGSFWEAQCYAWVHMCLYGMNKKYQKPFVRYLDRVTKEDPTEAIFKECFGKSYKDMAIELRGYLDFTNYTAVQFKAKKGQELPAPPDVPLLDAPDHVVGRLKGEVLRLAGHGESARNTLIAPYVRGERDPRLLAALGLDEVRAGQDQRATKFLEAAATAKVERARAYAELGRLRLNEARAKPAADGKIDQKQTAHVLEALMIARKQPPRMAATYALIAETYAASSVALKPEDFDIVKEGVKIFPRDVNLVMQATMLAGARGYFEDAQALARLGERVTKEEGEKERFRMLGQVFAQEARKASGAAEDTVKPAAEKPAEEVKVPQGFMSGTPLTPAKKS